MDLHIPDTIFKGMGLQRGKEEENHGVRESDRVPSITKGRIKTSYMIYCLEVTKDRKKS